MKEALLNFSLPQSCSSLSYMQMQDASTSPYMTLQSKSSVALAYNNLHNSNFVKVYEEMFKTTIKVSKHIHLPRVWVWKTQAMKDKFVTM